MTYIATCAGLRELPGDLSCEDYIAAMTEFVGIYSAREELDTA